MKTNAFTMIEILIVIVIMSLFFGLAVFNISSKTEASHLDTAAKRMNDLLNLARQNALSGQVGSDCAGTLTGYKVVIDKTNTTATVSLTCDNTEIVASRYTYSFKDTSGITIDTFDAIDAADPNNPSLLYNIKSMQFNSFKGGMSMVDPSDHEIPILGSLRARIIVKNTNTNMCAQFRMSPVGFINDCKISSCTDLSQCVAVIQ